MPSEEARSLPPEPKNGLGIKPPVVKINQVDKHSDPIKSLRSNILQSLDVGPETVEQMNLIEKDSFDKYLTLLLEKERYKVEHLKEANLNKLNMIIDKCISSDKFSVLTIEKILTFITPSPENENVIPKSASSILSNMRTKRGNSMSPKGHHKSFSDVPLLPVPNASPQPTQFSHNQQMPMIPSTMGGPPHYNSSQNMYMNQQTDYYSERNMNAPYMGQYQNNQPQFQNFSQTGQTMIPSYPMNPQMQSQGSSHELHQQYQSKLYNQEGRNLAPPHFVNASNKRMQGHRRTRSATVLPPNSKRSFGRSPGTIIQGTPRKPVSFLIHTPKHPPPT